MKQIFLMQNPIQTYAWGSHTAIAQLVGEAAPSEEPQAEMWMGAHPKAPSRVWHQGQWQRLDQLIACHPSEMLGAQVIERFGRRLPFLFKVLAAGQPLSIQAHPNGRQARDGFDRENRAGIALDAPHRNYKDDQHKPECICALTPFWGMCGFRSAARIEELALPVWPSPQRTGLELLKKDSQTAGLKAFFTFIMGLDAPARSALVDHVATQAAAREAQDAVYAWILRLNARYPLDIGVLAPLLLNTIQLQPGQALFLPAGQLHAYLEGLGMELMANSDNVLRGGLTPKHVDIPELLSVLDFEPYKVDVLQPRNSDSAEKIYASSVEEFVLSVCHPSGGEPFFCTDRPPGPQVLFCLQGAADIEWPQGTNRMTISKGQAVFIPHGVRDYTLKGQAKFYKAAVNIEPRS
jgi:mannose-6-phosphate isomerase